ncbi:unnamed protein product [Cuscuta campestris]|uniref:Hflx-type G domain-containing protein n=1 Tax=Cuscuta campestris TaxID=132261 RepID=A0A484LG90_9ASTE|nr:unnamed protein product [Cuscuta campestris]
MLRVVSQLRSHPWSPKTLPHLSPPHPIPSFRSLSGSPPRLQRRQDDDGRDEPIKSSNILVVQPRLKPKSALKPKLAEALNLANSLEEPRDGFYETEFSEKEAPPHIVVQNPAGRGCRADTYFGLGTVNTVKCHINALDSKGGVDAVFVNAMLSGVQQRNLGREWGKPVIDRVGLIIEIFNAHAQTKEAKLQAELAALMHKKSLLVRSRGPGGRSTFGVMGEAEVVSARGKGSGGRGFISGSGESELQLQRRRILERRMQLLSEIKEVRRTRALQRASRKRHGGSDGHSIATVAVVGYTNAGKSTLVSALTDNYLYSDDRLFATVDPKLSSVVLPSGRKVLLSDTVGFISDLPVKLVEAFHATLEEVVEADILLHVLDSSAPNLDEQRRTVLQVLEQIGVSEEKLENMIEVWNKIDLDEEEFHFDEEMEEKEEENDEVDNGEMNDENGDQADACWLASEGEEEEDSWVDYDGSSVGCGDSDASWVAPTKGWWARKKSRDLEAKSGLVPHVKTSAVTGVGLQELLELIDERVNQVPQAAPEATIFGRKWRPPPPPPPTEDATGTVTHVNHV